MLVDVQVLDDVYSGMSRFCVWLFVFIVWLQQISVAVALTIFDFWSGIWGILQMLLGLCIRTHPL